VFLYTSCTNCIQFARFVLAASNTDYYDFAALDAQQGLVRGLAVVAMSAVCLLLYVSNSKSKVVNKATAAGKILLLLGMVIAGAVYVGKKQSRGELSHDAASWQDTMAGTTSWPLAFITVLFSFHGWENATMVSILPTVSLAWKLTCIGCW
jgi:amino acid transporter